MATIAYQGATKIISGATATGAGSAYEVNRKVDGNQIRAFQATGATSAGAGSVTVAVQVSLTGLDNEWIVPSGVSNTITLTLGTTTTTDGFTLEGPWTYVRGNVTAISGTGATVNLYMGL